MYSIPTNHTAIHPSIHFLVVVLIRTIAADLGREASDTWIGHEPVAEQMQTNNHSHLQLWAI